MVSGKNRYISLALLEMTEERTNAIDNKKASIGVVIDLKTAFDTVNHNLLIKKLQMNGIRCILLKFLVSYLTKRTQSVYINDVKSDILEIVCGVPQGSILEPKLFFMYINDLCNVSSILKCILFVDDTNIFYSADSPELLSNTICQKLSKLHNRLAVNKLSLNINRTNYMVFGKGKVASDIAKIIINQNIIKRVYEENS